MSPIRNTLGVACEADELIIARHPEDVRAAANTARNARVPLTILASCSNVVLRSRLEGVVIHMDIRGRDVVSESTSEVEIDVAAGETWHEFVRWAVENDYAGVENLALIPGTVGAAPVQNIGAYGVEVGDRLVQVEVVDTTTGSIRTLTAQECGFGYRHSRFKSEAALCITRVRLRLSKKFAPVLTYPDVAQELDGSPPQKAQDVFDAVVRIRERKLPDPARHPNVGSFFKNPVVDEATSAEAVAVDPTLTRYSHEGRFKHSAAQLIDRAGWKGRTINGVQIWPRQPLVLVNAGATSARQFLSVAEQIRTDVERRYGIALELEPQVLGYD